MPDKEKQLTEQESLQLITQMISRAKNDFVDTGIGPILWGAVITVCSLVQAAKIYYQWQLPFDIWWLALAAIIPQILISAREKKERKAKGWDDNIMGYLWLVFGIGIFVVNVINNVMSHALDPALQYYREHVGTVHYTWSFGTCFLLFVYGFPTIITGAARKFHLMTAGGIICWVSAIVAAFTPVTIDFLLMALSATLAWLIPGLMIQKKYKAQKNGNV